MIAQRKQSLRFYHGGHRWDGAPEILPSAKGRAECGPGIYMTTHYETARKYAKGGGAVYEFNLSPETRWIKDISVELDAAIEFVRNAYRLKNKAAIIEDLQNVSLRMKTLYIPLDTVVNLFVNYEVLSGKNGPALASWIVEHGADAAVHSSTSHANEEWVTVFNPEVIVQRSRVDPDVGWAQEYFPTVKEQMGAVEEKVDFFDGGYPA